MGVIYIPNCSSCNNKIKDSLERCPKCKKKLFDSQFVRMVNESTHIFVVTDKNGNDFKVIKMIKGNKWSYLPTKKIAVFPARMFEMDHTSDRQVSYSNEYWERWRYKPKSGWDNHRNIIFVQHLKNYKHQIDRKDRNHFKKNAFKYAVLHNYDFID